VPSRFLSAQTWRRCIVAAPLLIASGAHAADEAPGPEQGVPGMEAHRIDEPVFNGHVVVYEAGRGNARGILLVHGVGQEGARDFRNQVDWLKQSYHVIAVDLPGFGQSDKANALYSPTNYIGVLKHVADRFLSAPFALVGHSMGGVVSLRYAATYPQDVRRLVVVDTPGILYRYAYASRYLAYLGLDFVPGEPLDRLTDIARRILTPIERVKFDPQSILDSPKLRQDLLDGDPAKIAGLAAVTDDLHLDLPGIRAETLVVWGAQDTLAPLRTGRVLAQKLPHARLVVIDGAAHVPMLEAPERFRAELEPFLERGLPPAPTTVVAPMAQHGEATCRRRRDLVFEGEYDRLTIERCQGIRIRNARIGELIVNGSTVTIDDSRIGGGETGLLARGSSIVMTGGSIEGGVAITAVGSRLDLAAVDIEGSGAAVTAPKRSYVVLSLCRVRSPHTQGEVHEFFTVTAKNPL
jgi:pimeloyl-ACP methyl ester carboxylesterase